MTGYAFWCSRCKISHAGECPPASTQAAASDDAHDWVAMAVIDLVQRYLCFKCGKTYSVTLMSIYGDHRPPPRGCPGP